MVGITNAAANMVHVPRILLCKIHSFIQWRIQSWSQGGFPNVANVSSL